MFFNKSRLKAINKDLYENNPKFYQHRLNLKELKWLFAYYKQVKNFEISNLVIATSGFFSTISLIEFLFTIGGSALFCFLLFGILGKSGVPHPNLLAFTTIFVIISLVYRLLLKRGIKIYFDENVKPEDSGILLSYMKGRIANDEKDKIMETLNVESVASNKESEAVGTRRRL